MTTTKQTKKEIRADKLNAHYRSLEELATICGVSNANGKKLSLQLWKLEQSVYKIVLDYANGENGVTSENWEDKVQPYREQVIKLFNGNLKGFYINSDPRGHALKINDNQYRQYYSNTRLTQDWGGNGLLSPEID